MSGSVPALRAQADEPDLGRIAFQLGWIKNFQFAGEYIADNKGYFRKFGLGVDLLSGGPGTIVDAIVASGKALVGQSSPDFMANAISRGAPIKCIGAAYQRDVLCVVSMARTPLVVPKDMIGKKIGIQTVNLVIWHAFLKLNRLDPASITTVPVQFDLTPLISGEVDGFFGDMNDDVVQLKVKGYDVHCLLMADYGYTIFTETYSVLINSLNDKTKRAQIIAFMKGDIMGWQDAIKDPALGAKLAVDVYGQGNGLDLNGQEASCVVTNDFMVSSDTQKHGLFWMSPSSVERTIASLGAAGIKATPDMFTNEILEEVYQGKNSVAA